MDMYILVLVALNISILYIFVISGEVDTWYGGKGWSLPTGASPSSSTVTRQRTFSWLWSTLFASKVCLPQDVKFKYIIYFLFPGTQTLRSIFSHPTGVF